MRRTCLTFNKEVSLWLWEWLEDRIGWVVPAGNWIFRFNLAASTDRLTGAPLWSVSNPVFAYPLPGTIISS